jgi:hypothetical protein
MRVGIKILDQASLRKILDQELAGLGYALANSDVDHALYRTHYCHLTHRSLGNSYLLKFTQRLPPQWDTATLIDARSNETLGRCNLFPTDNISTDNPSFSSSPPPPSKQPLDRAPRQGELNERDYLTWTLQIVAMVKAATSNNG